MQIQIRLPAEVGPSQNPLPPALAKIGANETVLIELQGSIKIEGEKSGELIGNLDVTNIVRIFSDGFTPQSILRRSALQCAPNTRYYAKQTRPFALCCLLSVVTATWLIYDPGEADTQDRPSSSRGEADQASEAIGGPVAQRQCRSCLLRYGGNSETEACFLKTASAYRWCICCRIVHQ
jgi:hypothetical protein